MNTFTINGKEYKAKPFDFGLVVELEDRGIALQDVQTKPMSFITHYVAICMNKKMEYASKEINQHIINGGKLEDILTIINSEVEQSGFFQALSNQK